MIDSWLAEPSLRYEESRVLVRMMFDEHPILNDLVAARTAPPGPELRAQLDGIMQRFAQEAHVTITAVPDRAVRAVRGGRDFGSMRSKPGHYEIEQSVYNDDVRLRKELTHQITAYLGSRNRETPDWHSPAAGDRNVAEWLDYFVNEGGPPPSESGSRSTPSVTDGVPGAPAAPPGGAPPAPKGSAVWFMPPGGDRPRLVVVYDGKAGYMSTGSVTSRDIEGNTIKKQAGEYYEIRGTQERTRVTLETTPSKPGSPYDDQMLIFDKGWLIKGQGFTSTEFEPPTMPWNDVEFEVKGHITNPQKLNEWIRSQGGKAIGDAEPMLPDDVRVVPSTRGVPAGTNSQKSLPLKVTYTDAGGSGTLPYGGIVIKQSGDIHVTTGNRGGGYPSHQDLMNRQFGRVQIGERRFGIEGGKGSAMVTKTSGATGFPTLNDLPSIERALSEAGRLEGAIVHVVEGKVATSFQWTGEGWKKIN
jgi:hypothetical protein